MFSSNPAVRTQIGRLSALNYANAGQISGILLSRVLRINNDNAIFPMLIENRSATLVFQPMTSSKGGRDVIIPAAPRIVELDQRYGIRAEARIREADLGQEPLCLIVAQGAPGIRR